MKMNHSSWWVRGAWVSLAIALLTASLAVQNGIRGAGNPTAAMAAVSGMFNAGLWFAMAVGMRARRPWSLQLGVGAGLLNLALGLLVALNTGLVNHTAAQERLVLQWVPFLAWVRVLGSAALLLCVTRLRGAFRAEPGLAAG
jgi:hypothetical protein